MIFLGVVDAMMALFYYILTLYFEIAIEKVVVCSILSFLLHPCSSMVWMVLCQFFSQNMEGYTVDEESCGKSQGE